MRERAGDVLGIEPLVEVDRGIDALHDLGRAARKPAAPRGVGGTAGGLAQRRRPGGRPLPRHGVTRTQAMKHPIRAITVLVLCLAGLGVLVYRQAAPLAAPAAPSAASRQPVTAGEGEFSLLDPPRPAPELGFTARDGTPGGSPISAARWCWSISGPPGAGLASRKCPRSTGCRRSSGPPSLVLAISEDRGGESAVAPFLAKLKLGHLAVYLDPKNGAIKAFGVQGLPTSFLIGRDGRMRAMLEGSTDWDTPAMIARLKPYLAAPPGDSRRPR